jgi:hypothetical protein
LQPVVGAMGAFAIDEQAKPIFEGEIGVLGIV